MSYNPKCRVGNWQEDISAREAEIEEFKRRQQAGTLLSQTVGDQLMAASTSVKLSRQEDGTLHIGDRVLLHHLSSDSYVGVLPSTVPSVDAHVPVVSAPGTVKPTSRTAVYLGSPQGPGSAEYEGEPIVYGSRFVIYAVIPGKGRMYLASEAMGLHSAPARKSKQQNVFAVEVPEESDAGDTSKPPSNDCLWEFVSQDPSYRFENEGQPARGNEPIIIKHVRTGRFLATLPQHVWKTEYGAQYEVTAHTHLDGRRIEQDENIFEVVIES